jgi:thioredoxin 1
MSPLISTDADFAANTSTGVTLVDFWAEWCGPCQIMLPRLEELASKVDGKAKVMKHDVDAEPATPGQFRIMSIPTIIIFKDGQPVEKYVGVQDLATLEAAIAKHV